MSRPDLDDLVLKQIPAFFGKLRKGAILSILLFLIIGGSVLWVVYAYPSAKVGPEQPIPFSHRLHVDIKGIDCRFCHPFVERSAKAGLPEVGKCLYCHEYIIPKHPEIQKIHKYYKSDQPIPWKRVFEVADHVLFRHQPHIKKGFDCVECHGPVETADRLPYVYFEMGFCIRCHQRNEGPLGCWLACHN